MPDAVVLCVALAVCTVPGLVVLASMGLRAPLLIAVMAVPVSTGLLGLTATVAALLGGPFGPGAVAALLTTAVALGVGRVLRRRPSSGAVERRTVAVPGRRVPPALQVAAALGVAGGAVVGVTTWLTGMGGLATYPQEHDTIVHTLLTAYISRTGRGAPWELLPADVLTGEPVYFYPSGMHLLSGLVADLTGDPVAALNAVTVVLLVVTFSTSTAALTIVAARQLRLSPAIGLLAAVVASLVAAGLYRPAVQMAHDGGSLPNAAAIAITPSIVAALLMLPWSQRRAGVGLGVACAGAVWIHPSVVVSVGLTALVWWTAQTFTASGRSELRRIVLPLLVTAATAAVAAAPVLLSSAAAASRTSAFPADTAPSGVSESVGATVAFAYGGYLDPGRTTGQMWIAVLVWFGVAAVVALRRRVELVAAALAWTAVSIAYFLSPATGIETIVTSFLYRALVRVWSHTSLLAPVLAGLGVAIAAGWIAVTARRQRLPVRPAWSTAAVVLLVAVAFAVGPGASYAARHSEAIASRYSAPHFVRVGDDDRAAAAWLAERIGPGERVLNSPNDGSTYLYVRYGIPIVNVYTLGLEQAPYSYELLQTFDDYPSDPAVRATLQDLHVAWVYVDTDAPSIGAGGSPRGWAGDGLFSLAPGFADIEDLPGAEPVFRSGSVTVYALDLGATRS